MDAYVAFNGTNAEAGVIKHASALLSRADVKAFFALPASVGEGGARFGARGECWRLSKHSAPLPAAADCRSFRVESACPSSLVRAHCGTV